MSCDGKLKDSKDRKWRSKPRHFKLGLVAKYSLADVAKMLGLSKGQVDRAEQSALRKIARLMR